MKNLSFLTVYFARHRNIAVALPLATVAMISFGATSVGSSIPVVKIASEPIFTHSTHEKPTLTLALSVEYPTVGQQYLDVDYLPTKQYLGYFDSESCYIYVADPSPELRRFDRSAAAVGRTCGGVGFSGNFMNWSTSSAIDILRFGLTGGDRIVDTTSMTVLQRAVLPENFWNNEVFLSKKLPAKLVAGALPTAMLGSHSGDVYVANCLNRISFGTVAEGSCQSPKRNGNLGVKPGNQANFGAIYTKFFSPDDFFYARVRVCETDTNGVALDSRKSMCVRYPNGQFKPVGNLQKYSDRMRIAVFGYLLDNDVKRYGGVLRAPMKFVGPTQYDGNGVLMSATNPNAEWDLNTGIFRANPENASPEKTSGVINYINQFGRTGPVLAQYKSFDPVSELHYEAIRYLQGLPPTPQAIVSLNNGMRDGFPVYTNWVDPYGTSSNKKNYACLKNNILTVGDQHTHDDKSIPGNTSFLRNQEFSRSANLAGNEPDFYEWTRVVGAFESNIPVGYLDGKGAAQTTRNPNPPNTARWGMEKQIAGLSKPYGPVQNMTAGYLMSGVAYWANTHDIRGDTWSDVAKRRPGMRVVSYFLDVNERADSFDNVYRHNSPFFLAAKYGGFTDKGGIGNPFFAADGTVDNNNWQKPVEPGEAGTYFLPSSANSVLKALDDIFASVSYQSNSIAGGAISQQQITTSGGHIYLASFDTTYWSGDVVSYPVTVSSGKTTTLGSTKTPQWSAAAQLSAKNPATRSIFIGNQANRDTASAFKAGSVETGPGSVTDFLDRQSPMATADNNGTKRLNYLRGDRSLEGVLFRLRASPLGDIVNSSVAYSGAPSNQISDPDYSAFAQANAARPATLFVGANDGMLHAFDAATGAEHFAYIPSWLSSKLSALTDPSYSNGNHQSYVDGNSAVGEAKVGSSWKTVLVGSTGAGGQGVFGLDVTNPAGFSASNLLWEFTDRDDVDMGNIIGRPQILKMRISEPKATPVYKYFAVVASGLNNYESDGFASTSGNPALFLLDLSKPAGDKWLVGKNYFKVIIPIDNALKTTRATGVVSFTAEGGAVNEVTKIYLGDLHGRIWKLDFSANGVTNWSMNKLSPFSTSNNTLGEPTGTAIPFYIATDRKSASVGQPITVAPNLLVGPNRSTIVAFGTGKYLESADSDAQLSTQVQSFYALYDDGTTVADKPGISIIADRQRLAVATQQTGGVITTPPFVWGRATSASDPLRSGWAFDYPVLGEKQISSAAVAGSQILFGSIIPPDGTSDSCGSGSGNLYSINIGTGAGDAKRSITGALTTPLIPEIGDASTTVTNATGRRIRTVSRQVIIQGAGGLEVSDVKTIKSITGRLSWRQINNYKQLRK